MDLSTPREHEQYRAAKDKPAAERTAAERNLITWMEGGTVPNWPPRHYTGATSAEAVTTISVTCHYTDGDTIVTRFNGTFEQAQAYFVGQTFNIGIVDDNMQRCVSITQNEQ